MRNESSLVQLDAIDVSILNELQANARLTNLDLAQRIHLSPSACLRRVKRLEDAGVIAQYAALLNPKAVGQHGTSFTRTRNVAPISPEPDTCRERREGRGGASGA